MGWANCGDDSKGRPIGYAHDATCDHPGCEAEIHRGLAHACGQMHGETEDGCEGYFCGAHLRFSNSKDGQLCFACDEAFDKAREEAFPDYVSSIQALAEAAGATKPGEPYCEPEAWRDAYDDNLTPQEAFQQESQSAAAT